MLRYTATTTVLVVSLIVSALSQAAEKQPVPLFNGKDLAGWTHYLWDSAARQQDTTTPMSAVWSVENGILICQGRPTGYIRTDKEYENYRLALEWRWPEGTTRGNNGVLVHTSTPNALGQWPKSIEVQLALGNAGDFWVIGTTLEVPDLDTRRRERRHLNLTDDSEKPVGEWNKMEIVCKRDEIIAYVNGVLVNHATKCSVTKGAISLQSEGALVHFRSITLTPLALSASVDVTGKWSGTFQLQTEQGGSGTEQAFLILRQDGSTVTGRAGPNEGEQHPIQNGRIDGDKLTFDVTRKNRTIYFDLTSTETEIKGDVRRSLDGKAQTAKLSLKRVPRYAVNDPLSEEKKHTGWKPVPLSSDL